MPVKVCHFLHSHFYPRFINASIPYGKQVTQGFLVISVFHERPGEIDGHILSGLEFTESSSHFCNLLLMSK